MQNKKLVYKHEEPLFILLAIISAILWVLFLVASAGTLLIFLAIGFIFYLFGHSALIAHYRGRGALIGTEQFPDLHQQVQACIEKIGMTKIPDVFVVNGNGVFNAFATKFLSRHYVILYSSVIDALQDQPDAINFYIGHELGHLHRRHLLWHTLLAPGAVIPLAGAAYYRACEYTCDRYGAFCCTQAGSAQRALAVLGVGAQRWKTFNIDAHLRRLSETGGFWMSFNELLASYPWLIKRIAAVAPIADARKVPGRNPFAYVLGIFIPRPSITTLLLFYVLFAFGSISAMKQFSKLASLPQGYSSTAHPAYGQGQVPWHVQAPQ